MIVTNIFLIAPHHITIIAFVFNLPVLVMMGAIIMIIIMNNEKVAKLSHSVQKNRYRKHKILINMLYGLTNVTVQYQMRQMPAKINVA